MASIQKRITKEGRTTYRALVRIKGSPTKSATFDRHSDARRWSQKKEEELRQKREKEHETALSINETNFALQIKKLRKEADERVAEQEACVRGGVRKDGQDEHGQRGRGRRSPGGG